jgi:hypothetical protein
MHFEIVSNGKIIGLSEFEQGDPPMGVASGRFLPNEEYRIGIDVENDLRVRPEGGEFLSPEGGVVITNYSADLGPDGIEVAVLGLDAETYQSLFPQHVRAYESQFESRNSEESR